MTEPGEGMVRVEVDLVPDAELIRGCARGADGMEHSFVGWLELVDVLDRARMGRPLGGSGSQPHTEGKPR